MISSNTDDLSDVGNSRFIDDNLYALFNKRQRAVGKFTQIAAK